MSNRVTLPGKDMDPTEWLRQQVAGERKDEQEKIASAKADAAHNGKEPFDLDRFEKMHDVPGSWGDQVCDREVVTRELERKYYLWYPEIKTLEEFAARLAEYDPYR